jgi:hypothetical protein
MSRLTDPYRTLERVDHVELAIVLAEALLEDLLEHAKSKGLKVKIDEVVTDLWHPYQARIAPRDEPDRDRILATFSTEQTYGMNLHYRLHVHLHRARALAMELAGKWRLASENIGALPTITWVLLRHDEVEGIINLAQAHLLHGRKRS